MPLQINVRRTDKPIIYLNFIINSFSVNVSDFYENEEKKAVDLIFQTYRPIYLMGGVKRSIISVIIISLPAFSFAQNWMMAQRYLTAAIDSVIQINWPNTGKLKGYNIDHVEYDSTYRNIFITFTDTVICDKLDIPLKTTEEPDIVASSGELIVGLKGGEAILKEENGDVSDLELPDFSEAVYIYNETGSEISFEISKDDKKFVKNNLNPGEFHFISCRNAEFVFIKIQTISKGKEIGNIHYKLTAKDGYKVKFDTANSKYEVYIDERMEILDFKE
jgi:hypothetical protein